jgi:ABC-type Mn2+/Zn2+ transport system permease subunit
MTFLQILMMLLVAVASGIVGVFALMKKMTLAADSISHVALPGLGLAFLFKINPLIGGLAALMIGAFLIWSLENKTRVATETIIGVFFSASLAIGSLLTPGEELLDILFGEGKVIDQGTLIFGIIASLLIIGFVVLAKEKLVLSLISTEVAIVTGINVSLFNLLFLLVFSLNIILGLQFLGVLLMGSLIIVPAAISRNLSWSLNSALVISAIAAVVSIVLGLVISSLHNISLGPTVISIASVIFFLSLMKRK